MNFSVHLKESLVEELDRQATETGKTRNALIREAVSEWLERRRRTEWPSEIRNFKGVKLIKRFEEGRKDLKEPRDPFRAIPS